MKTIKERIDAAWESRKLKTDWLGLESVLRDILRKAAPTPELRTIDEAIAAFTGRGLTY